MLLLRSWRDCASKLLTCRRRDRLDKRESDARAAGEAVAKREAEASSTAAAVETATIAEAATRSAALAAEWAMRERRGLAEAACVRSIGRFEAALEYIGEGGGGKCCRAGCGCRAAARLASRSRPLRSHRV